MQKKGEDWREEIEQKHGKLRWVANVDKDDLITRKTGHIVGPPKAEDPYSMEELEEKGVVGIYVRVGGKKK